MIGRYSLKRPIRCAKSRPNAVCSWIWLPAPMPEDHAPAGELLERAGHLRHQRRVAEGRRQDVGAELDAARS